MNYLALSLAIAAGMVGCAAPRQKVVLKNSYDEAAHAPYLLEGTSLIQGQAFLRQKGGGTVTCAGSKVLMFPATPFFNESIEIMRAGNEPILPDGKKPGEKNKAMLKQSQCDAQGNFVFESVPSGKWKIVTQVQWQVGYTAQGGVLAKDVEVGAMPTRVLLSDTDLLSR